MEKACKDDLVRINENSITTIIKKKNIPKEKLPAGAGVSQ